MTLTPAQRTARLFGQLWQESYITGAEDARAGLPFVPLRASDPRAYLAGYGDYERGDQ